jgi:hypothetical protein
MQFGKVHAYFELTKHHNDWQGAEKIITLHKELCVKQCPTWVIFFVTRPDPTRACRDPTRACRDPTRPDLRSDPTRVGHWCEMNFALDRGVARNFLRGVPASGENFGSCE